MQALRRQLAGALPLSEQERHAQLLQQLREDKRSAEAIKEEARQDQERVKVSIAGESGSVCTTHEPPYIVLHGNYENLMGEVLCSPT